MKKYGKYETKPVAAAAKQPKVKSALLQTYITSLLCMVLCVTMFFGTSFAWFTREVTDAGNEINVGILKVGLYKDTVAPENDLSKDNIKLFDGTIRWEPGYTSLETIKVVNEGDLAFKYEMAFTSTDADVEAVAKNFEVWVFNHYGKTYTKPTSYEAMAADSNWVKIGTLAEVLNGKSVLEDRNMYTVRDTDANTPANENTTDGVATVDTYTIALHMNQSASDAALMGKKITLNVKLNAYQMGSEQDSFGDSYDNIRPVFTAEEFKAAVESANGGTIVLAKDIEMKDSLTINKAVKIDLDNHRLTTNAVTIDTENVTVSNGDWTLVPEAGMPPVIVKSNLTLNDVDVSCNKMFYTASGYGEAVAISVEGGTLKVEGGSITALSNGGVTFSYAYCVALMNGATFEMKGGELIASEPTGKGEAGESSFAVLANGSSTMSASLQDVKISKAHYIAGANGGTLNIVLKNVSYDESTTNLKYQYDNGTVIIAE